MSRHQSDSGTLSILSVDRILSVFYKVPLTGQRVGGTSNQLSGLVKLVVVTKSNVSSHMRLTH